MMHDEKGALPPSYSDSMSHGQPSLHYGTHQPSPRTQPLLTHLSQTRTTHINSIITNDILPLIEAQASLGIAQTTIAMLPSDIPLTAVQEKSEFSFDTDTTKAVEVIGFSSEAEPKVVSLGGQMNRTEFWRVQAVITELEETLHRRLNESVVLRSPMRTEPTRQKRSMLGRIMPSLGPEQKSPSGNPEVGVRRRDQDMGMVLVKARLEEICLRTVTEFGLYDTMSRQCVIVRVDARC